MTPVYQAGFTLSMSQKRWRGKYIEKETKRERERKRENERLSDQQV